MARYTTEFQALRKDKGIDDTFQEIGRENENVKVIGIQLEISTEMRLDVDHTRHYYDKKTIVTSVLTGRVPYKCWDWPLYRKIRKDDRFLELQNRYGIPLRLNVISGTKGISIEGEVMTEEDIENYLYGKHPLNPNFEIVYIKRDFLHSNLDS